MRIVTRANSQEAKVVREPQNPVRRPTSSSGVSCMSAITSTLLKSGVNLGVTPLLRRFATAYRVARAHLPYVTVRKNKDGFGFGVLGV